MQEEEKDGNVINNIYTLLAVLQQAGNTFTANGKTFNMALPNNELDSIEQISTNSPDNRNIRGHSVKSSPPQVIRAPIGSKDSFVDDKI